MNPAEDSSRQPCPTSPGARAFSRVRLFARLDEACRARVALVLADEGLGKSTLVRDYLAARAIPHLWFTATPAHAVPSELVRGLAATFGALRPAMARSVRNAAAQLERAEGGDDAALQWAREHLAGAGTTVVLDELHHLAGAERCAAFLSALIETAPPGIRWIVADRDGSWLPVPRWLASGVAALPIESPELRVRPEEIRAAFRSAGFALSAADADALHERTGGWALALSVALATGRLDLSPAPADVYDGLVEAALRDRSDDDLDRVCELACAARFDARIAAALECEPGLIEDLRERGLIFASGGGHAFHQPPRARIEQRLERFAPERRGIVFDRAAAALERAGRWVDAVALRLRAGDPERLAAALEKGGFPALDHGEVPTLARALAVLPDDVLARFPVALALKAALASLDESFDVSEAWFRIAIDAARDGARRQIVIRYGTDLVRRGRPDVVELLEAEAERGETRASPDADAALWGLLATAYVETHDIEGAREAAKRALARLPGVEDDALRPRVLHQAAYVALSANDYAGAKSLAERALARAEESFLYDLAARALSVLYNVAMLHEDDVAAALLALARLEEAGRKAGSDSLRLYAILAAYALEVDAGDTAALARLDGELAQMQVLFTPTVSEALLPAQALRAGWEGRFAHAYEMLAPGAEKLFDDDRIAYRWAEIAAYAAAAEKVPEARRALEAARATLRTLDRGQPLAIRTAAYVALAEVLLGGEEAARAAIDAARAAARGRSARMNALVEAVAAFHACRTDEASAYVALGEALDELDRRHLRGVARFIGRLPMPRAARLAPMAVA